MKEMLHLADLVKFAKAHPTPLENDVCLNHCVDFINETKPAPAPAAGNGNGTENNKPETEG